MAQLTQLLHEPAFYGFLVVIGAGIAAIGAWAWNAIKNHMEEKEVDAMCDANRDKEFEEFRELLGDVKAMHLAAVRKGLNPNLLVVGIKQKLILQNHYFFKDKKSGDKISIAGKRMLLLTTSEPDLLAVYEKRPFSWLS